MGLGGLACWWWAYQTCFTCDQVDCEYSTPGLRLLGAAARRREAELSCASCYWFLSAPSLAICREPASLLCTLLTCASLPAPACSAVQHMALRKMSVAFQSWRYLTAFRQHARAVVEQSVVRLSHRTLASAWQAWQQYVAEKRVARHRVAVCQRRQATALQRSALAGWRHEAACKAAERRAVALCQRRADRNRSG